MYIVNILVFTVYFVCVVRCRHVYEVYYGNNLTIPIDDDSFEYVSVTKSRIDDITASVPIIVTTNSAGSSFITLTNLSISDAIGNYRVRTNRGIVERFKLKVTLGKCKREFIAYRDLSEVHRLTCITSSHVDVKWIYNGVLLNDKKSLENMFTVYYDHHSNMDDENFRIHELTIGINNSKFIGIFNMMTTVNGNKYNTRYMIVKPKNRMVSRRI